MRCFQCEAIGDAARTRALKAYNWHAHAKAIGFVDHVIEEFPFRVCEIRIGDDH